MRSVPTSVVQASCNIDGLSHTINLFFEPDGDAGHSILCYYFCCCEHQHVSLLVLDNFGAFFELLKSMLGHSDVEKPVTISFCPYHIILLNILQAMHHLLIIVYRVATSFGTFQMMEHLFVELLG